jgi:hypothetical protein
MGESSGSPILSGGTGLGLPAAVLFPELFQSRASEPMMGGVAYFDRIAEARIREAVEQGAFRGLPGEGRPLDLEDLTRLPEDLRASYMLLKGANVLPEEMQLRKELVTLENLLAACRDGEESQELREKLEAIQVRHAILMEKRLERPLAREYRARAAGRLSRRGL